MVEKKRDYRRALVYIKRFGGIVGICIISFVIAPFIEPGLIINKDLLYWFSSTIAQAFGALLALLWIVILTKVSIEKNIYGHLRSFISENFKELNVNQQSPIGSYLMVKQFEEGVEQEKRELKEELYWDLGKCLMFMVFLIGSSIALLVFTEAISNYLYNYYFRLSITFVIVYLSLISFYCLYLIVHNIHKSFSRELGSI